MSIFKPEISKVIKGIKGKSIFIYGDIRTGKSTNASLFEKPYWLACEPGLNMIDGIPFKRVTRWMDIKRTVEEFADNVEEARKIYSTIVIDGTEAFGSYAEQYIADIYKVRSVGEGNRGYGLWGQLEQELSQIVLKLTSLGFTVLFLGHPNYVETTILSNGKEEKILKAVPQGNKRLVDPLLKSCDIVAFAYISEEGKDANLYLQKSPHFEAGSRIKYIVPVIEEWTKDKLEKAIIDAIEEKEKAEGIKAVSYEHATEQVIGSNDLTALDEIKKDISEIVVHMSLKDPNYVEYQAILRRIIGTESTKEFSVGNATEDDRDILETILLELRATKAGKELKAKK